MNKLEAKEALQWYIDHGVDAVLEPTAINCFEHNQSEEISATNKQNTEHSIVTIANKDTAPLGAAEATAEAIELAQNSKTLDDLRNAIENFDGISLKKTATNLVFSEGHPKSRIMLIGDVPGTDEDRNGHPFSGTNGQLLDKILFSINLDRSSENPENSVYISNILNWRPPGNRSPSAGEIETSLPFIERHIQLINPDILILCGAITAKTLLARNEGISRLRKTWHSYKTLTKELETDAVEIPALVTFHPSYLLNTPAQKKAAWADMLMIQDKSKLFRS